MIKTISSIIIGGLIIFVILINITPGTVQYDCYGLYYGTFKQCPEGGMLPNPLSLNESNRFNLIRNLVALLNNIDFNK